MEKFKVARKATSRNVSGTNNEMSAFPIKHMLISEILTMVGETSSLFILYRIIYQWMMEGEERKRGEETENEGGGGGGGGSYKPKDHFH